MSHWPEESSGEGTEREYPILEFDPAPEAIIDPGGVVDAMGVPDHCVACFFRNVVEAVGKRPDARLICERTWECGSYPPYEIQVEGKRLAVFRSRVGAPMAVGMFEELIALGCRKLVACGGPKAA